MTKLPSSTPALREFISGGKDTIPMMIAAMPFGLIFGAIAVSGERALTPAAAQGMSLIVFAGSAQFIALGLYTSGVSLPFIVFTTFIVNLRHALYAASLAPYLRLLKQRWLLPMGYLLTDETYAVVINRYQARRQSQNSQWYYLGSALPFYVNWQLSTLAGIVAGSQMSGAANWGLDFAMTATFIGIVVPLLKSRSMIACAITAAAVSLATFSLPNRLGLLIGGLAGIAIGMLIQALAARKRRRRQQG